MGCIVLKTPWFWIIKKTQTDYSGRGVRNENCTRHILEYKSKEMSYYKSYQHHNTE